MDQASDRFRWRFVEADAGERAAFPSLAATLACAEQHPFVPPNRRREVRRVAGPDGRRYFLKVFRRVQVKNLVRNLTTRPRTAVDGAREAAVAAALRARGFRAPRPVAVGTAGLGSALLLAELPGEPFRDRIATGRCPRVLADRVATHCGTLLRGGFVLPDLSADHVLLDGDDPDRCAIGVLDLHDGTLGPLRYRALRRSLRRFLRSVRGLTIPRAAALRFASMLCRAAGAAHLTRRAVASLPPLDTHGRYDTGGRAVRYAERNPARNAQELDLLREVWPGRAGDTVLDVPCGAGRLRRALDAVGARWHGADRSRTMLAVARDASQASSSLCAADARELPFADRSFDGVVVFRFLHHLPTHAARVAVLEACRVAERYVVVSFFHPVSAHNFRRRVAEWTQGRAPTRFCVTRRTLDGWAAAAGFRPTGCVAQSPYLRDLWIAAYERSGAGSEPGLSRRSG